MKHYVHEAGTDLILDTGINIGSAPDHYISYRTPGGVEGSFAADLYSSYSVLALVTGTYLLKHTLVYGDLIEAGEWIFQAYIGAVDGTWRGESVAVNIQNNFE